MMPVFDNDSSAPSHVSRAKERPGPAETCITATAPLCALRRKTGLSLTFNRFNPSFGAYYAAIFSNSDHATLHSYAVSNS